MPVTRTDTARKFLAKELEKLSEHEREIVQRFIDRGRTARNVAQEFEEHLTMGQRIADRVAATMGSWTFIIIQSSILLAWIVLNVVAYMNHWDPYPFILLNLGLSFQAAYAAPIIMMSQNRQADKDRMMVEHDYQINTKAEREVKSIHEKFNELRDNYWAELVQMQQRQIEMLERLVSQVCEHQREP